ncbi:MAG: GAF domain-containing protein [Anaerolineae bacterium]|nr:GAF domain-containing protein [Anaerolineae bacterium]
MLPDPYSALFDDADRNVSSDASENNEIVFGQTLETLERRNQELQLLHELATRLNKSIETKQAMEVGLDLVVKLTGAESIAIVLINSEEGHSDLVAHNGIEDHLAAKYAVSPFDRAVYEPGKIDPETTRNLAEYVILTRRSLTTQDFQAMPRFNLAPILDSGYQSILALPIYFDAQVFGFVMLGSKLADQFDQHTVQLGENISAQLGLTLRSRSLLTDLTRQVAQMRAVVETGSLLQYAPRAQSALPEVLLTIRDILHTHSVAVLLLNGDHFEIVSTTNAHEPRFPLPISPHHRRLLESDEPLVVNDRSAPDVDPIQRVTLERLGRQASMGIRLYARDHAFGLLFVVHNVPHRWQPDEKQLVKAFAHQIAYALENKRLLEWSQKQVRELKSLSRVGRLIATSNPPDNALYAAADEIARVMRVDYVSFHLREGEFLCLVAESRYSGAPARLPIQAHQYRILAELDPVRVNDCEQDAASAKQREFLRAFNIRADLGVALVSEQKALGILYISQQTPRAWNDDDIELAQTFAQQIAGALTNARFLRDSQNQVRDLRALARTSTLIAHSRSPETALSQAASDLRRVLAADYVGFHLLEGDEFRIVTEAQHKLSGLRYPIKPYHKFIVEHGQKLVIHDRERDAPEEALRETLIQFGYQAEVGVPMVSRGKTTGILFVSQKATRLWREGEIHLIETYAQQIATVLENVQLLNEKARQVLELEQLTELNEMAASNLDQDVLIEMSMTALKQLLNADRVLVATIENGMLQPVRSSDGMIHPEQPARPSKQLQELLWSKDPFIVDPLHPHQSSDDLAERARFHGARSWMTIPLLSVNETLGILGFVFLTEHIFTSAEIRLAVAAANQLAMAFANARLLRDQNKRIDRQSRLSEFGLWCSTVRDSAALIEQAAERVRLLLDSAGASIRLLNGDTLSAGASAGYRDPDARAHPIAVSAGLHRILNQRKPYQIRDLETHVGVPAHWRERQLREGYRSLLMAPMVAESHAIGLLTVFRSTVQDWDESEIQYAQTVANTLALALVNERQIEHAREQSDELRATLDSVFSGVFTTDREGKILSWNNAASKITGLGAQEMYGKMWHKHGPRVGAHRRADMIVFEAMEGNSTCFSLAPRSFTCADGRVIELREAAAPLLSRSGQVRGAVCAFWDRTEEQSAERAKVDFINLVAHQLNNKLAVLIWSAERMQRDDLSVRHRQDLLAVVSRMLNELRAFNARFVEFQREHSRQEIEESEVDLQSFLQAKIQVWRSTRPTHRFSVSVGEGKALADEMRLDVVIDNLLDNAVKYSEPKSKITLRGRRVRPDLFELNIHNPGKPINPELSARLFERFERGNSAEPGFGLGLWLVRTKLHEMGGDIFIQSPRRGGTTLRITLRCKPPAPESTAKTDEGPEIGAAA